MIAKFFIVYVLSISLLSCSLHRIDIQQGNLVTQEMLDQLQLKMPAHKVRFIMGTPLVMDTFHQNRWDYVYIIQPAYKKPQQRRLTLLFDENQKLKKIEGNVKIGKRKLPQQSLPDEFDEEPIL
jgi:outer membrane protein assembly factor BamE